MLPVRVVTMENQFDPWHWIGHVASGSVILTTIFGLLPGIAALAAVIWYAIQIYESTTAQKWLDKRRMVYKARRIAKLRAQQKVLLAELEALEVLRVARGAAADKVAVAASEAAELLVDHKTHEKIHEGGKIVKSTQPD